MSRVYKQFLFVSFIHKIPFPYWDSPAKKRNYFFSKVYYRPTEEGAPLHKKQNKAKPKKKLC